MWSNDDRVGLGAAGTGTVLVCLTAAVLYAWLGRVPLPAEAVRTVPAGSYLAYNAGDDDPLVLRRGEGRLEVVKLHLSITPVLPGEMRPNPHSRYVGQG